MFDSGHLTLVSGAEVVSKKVGKEVRGVQGSRGGPVSRERHRYHTHASAGTQGARENTGRARRTVLWTLDFGVFAFLPFSLGPAGFGPGLWSFRLTLVSGAGFVHSFFASNLRGTTFSVHGNSHFFGKSASDPLVDATACTIGQLPAQPAGAARSHRDCSHDVPPVAAR